MLPNTSFHMKMNHSILFFNVCIYPSSSERIRTLRTRDCTSSEKDGRCFITFFLINPESSYYLNAGLSPLGFYHQIDNCYVLNKDIPNFAVAYLEEDIRTLLNKYGLEMQTPPHYGSWCGRTEHTSYQDIILTQKISER